MVSTKTPKISIVLPTYNRSHLIGRAIESVLNQSFGDWELVIIDDASDDETEEVLKRWRARDERITVAINQASNHPDISKTLNYGLKLSKGKYIARLDDDDWWIDNDKLKKQFEFLENNPDYVVVGGGAIVFNENKKELFRYFKKEKDEDIRKSALFANPFSHTTTLFRKDVALEVGGYGNWLYAEDWDLWLKMGVRGKLYNFQEYFTAYVMSGNNKSFVHQRAQSKMILEFIKIYRHEYPGFCAAYALGLLQYFYSFLPLSLRRVLHPILSSVKRGIF